jgi:magnesium transporter
MNHIEKTPPKPKKPDFTYLPRRSVGQHLSTSIPTALSDETIGQVRQRLIEKGTQFDSFNYIYIVSKSDKLKGVVSIKSIFTKKDDVVIRDVMSEKIVKVGAHTDQEKTAYLALSENLKSIPVVDKEDNFLGVFSSDQILSMLDKESRKDFLHLAGILPKSKKDQLLKTTTWISLKQRLPWIVTGLFGGLFGAYVISLFEHVLETDLLLASFIPLVAYLANAVGVQTQTLFIRDLATNPNIKLSSYIIRQIILSAIIGLVCGSLIVGISVVVWKSFTTGLAVGISVLVAIQVASIFALLIPLILTKLNKDPAVGSGPFSTIIQDILSIVIYFLIASQFISSI